MIPRLIIPRLKTGIAVALWAGALSAVAAMHLAADPVAAHPLGNTSVNAYERVEISTEAVLVRYVLDVSEIPALREQRFADTDDDGMVDESEATIYLDGLWEYVSANLSLTIAGEETSLNKEEQTLTFPPGQGGLTLMRAVFDTSAPMPPLGGIAEVEAMLIETTFDGVPGWHEIIVVAGDGVTLAESSVPAEDVSDELTAYPPDRLTTPLSVREATFRFALNTGAPSSTLPTETPSDGPRESAAPSPSAPDDPLVALLGPSPTLAAMFVGVFLAIALGAAHAISPGHGKTLVAAYVIGSRANIGQALWLGLTVAVTHTAGVLILGVVTYLAAELVFPERVVGWLSVAAGLTIIALGALLIRRAWMMRASLGTSQHHGHTHGNDSDHDALHDHPDHAKSHDNVGSAVALRRRDVALLGIIGGLIPSTSALLLLLSSVSLGQVAFGIVLIVAFGVGMALVLTSISGGIVLLRHSRLLAWERWSDPRLATIGRLVPLISGVIVIAFGIVLTTQAANTIR